MENSKIKREDIEVDADIPCVPAPPGHVELSQVKREEIDVDADIERSNLPLPALTRNRAKVGCVSLDEGKRIALEVMHRVGAMRAKEVGHGYYVCKFLEEGCKAACVIKKGKLGEWTSKWSEAHKQGCRAIGAHPAFMQNTAVQFVREHRSQTRVEIQGHTAMRAFSGNAFGQERIHKQLQRNREGCRKVVNLLTLQSMVAASTEKCVLEGDVALGYRSWAGASDPYDVDISLGDWDANAPIPEADSDADGDEDPVVVVLEESVPPEALPDAVEQVTDGEESVDEQSQSTTATVPEPVKPVAPANSVSVLVSRRALLAMLQKHHLMRNIDATFDMAPQDSCLMTAGYLERGIHMPVAWAISTSRGCKSYESAKHTHAVFDCVLDAASELLGVAGVTAWKAFSGKWMRDGGKGYNKAIREYFPSASQAMCFFHLMQAVHRRQKQFPRAYDKIIETLRALHLITDPTEFAIGMDLFLREMRKSVDGRVFVRYWRNTHFGLGCCDGNWAFTHAGIQTTNNGLERFNGQMKEMVGSGRKRASVLYCVHKLLVVISEVTKRQTTKIEGHEERTMWSESHLKEATRVQNKAGPEGLKLRAAMLETHTIDDVHVLQRGGVGITTEKYTAMLRLRVRSLSDWLAFVALRHTCSENCTCATFLHWSTCKHVCALQILSVPEDPTPDRRIKDTVATARAPSKKEREEPSVFQGALIDATNRQSKRIKIKSEDRN